MLISATKPVQCKFLILNAAIMYWKWKVSATSQSFVIWLIISIVWSWFSTLTIQRCQGGVSMLLRLSFEWLDLIALASHLCCTPYLPHSSKQLPFFQAARYDHNELWYQVETTWNGGTQHFIEMKPPTWLTLLIQETLQNYPVSSDSTYVFSMQVSSCTIHSWLVWIALGVGFNFSSDSQQMYTGNVTVSLLKTHQCNFCFTVFSLKSWALLVTRNSSICLQTSEITSIYWIHSNRKNQGMRRDRSVDIQENGAMGLFI